MPRYAFGSEPAQESQPHHSENTTSKPQSKCPLISGIIAIIVGIALIIIGIILPFIIVKTIGGAINETVKTKTQDQDAAAYGKWADSNNSEAPSVFFEGFVYNITNHLDVIQTGAQPIVQEVGPYVYREFTQKFNVSFSDDLDEVSYEYYTYKVFDAALSLDKKTGRALNPATDTIYTVWSVIDSAMTQAGGLDNLAVGALFVPTFYQYLGGLAAGVKAQTGSPATVAQLQASLIANWGTTGTYPCFNTTINFQLTCLSGFESMNITATAATNILTSSPMALLKTDVPAGAGKTAPGIAVFLGMMANKMLQLIMDGLANSEVQAATMAAAYYQPVFASTATGWDDSVTTMDILAVFTWCRQAAPGMMKLFFGSTRSTILPDSNPLLLIPFHAGALRYVKRTPYEVLLSYIDPLARVDTSLFATDTSYAAAFNGPKRTVKLGTGQVNIDRVDETVWYKGLNYLPKQKFDGSKGYWCSGDLNITGRYSPAFSPASIDGFNLKPRVTKTSRLSVFVPQIYQTGYFSFQETAKVKGVDVLRFSMEFEPALGVNNQFGNKIRGIGDVTCPAAGLPFIFSLPNYADANVTQYQIPAGMKVDTQADQPVFIDVHPETGIVINAELRLLLSTTLVKGSTFGGSPTNTTYIPLGGVFKHASLTDDQATKLKGLTTIMTLRLVIIVVLIIVGVLVALLGGFCIRRHRNKSALTAPIN